MNETITYVGLDVHKETIAVSLADGSGRGDVRSFGQIVNTPAALSRLLTKLVRKRCFQATALSSGLAAYAHGSRSSIWLFGWPLTILVRMSER